MKNRKKSKTILQKRDDHEIVYKEKKRFLEIFFGWQKKKIIANDGI